MPNIPVHCMSITIITSYLETPCSLTGRFFWSLSLNVRNNLTVINSMWQNLMICSLIDEREEPQPGKTLQPPDLQLVRLITDSQHCIQRASLQWGSNSDQHRRRMKACHILLHSKQQELLPASFHLKRMASLQQQHVAEEATYTKHSR